MKCDKKQVHKRDRHGTIETETAKEMYPLTVVSSDCPKFFPIACEFLSWNGEY